MSLDPLRWALAITALASLSLAASANAQDADADADAAVDASVVQDAAAPDATAVQPPPPLDAKPIEPPTAVLGDEEGHAITDKVRLIVIPPYEWEGADSATLDIPDFAQVPGAETVLNRTWSPGESASEMFVVCATGRATDWAPGMESLLIERLNAIAKTELGKRMTVDALAPGKLEETPPIFLQDFEAKGKAGGDRREGSVRVLEVDRLDSHRAAVEARGRHIIAFLPDPERVLVCSAACVEPEGDRDACDASVKSLHLDGPLADEPSPSFTGRLILGIKRRPAALLGTAFGLILALAGVLAILRGLLIRPSASA